MALGVPLVRSFEEYALAAQPAAVATPPAAAPKTPMPMGAIGPVRISRLICGGNLVSGYAHSRDLIYVSTLLKHYFTDEKILETWSMSERHGINTMILSAADARTVGLYQKHRANGGSIQYLAQIGPSKGDLKTVVKEAKAAGAVGAFLLGNVSDAWTREGDVKLIGELMRIIRDHGLIAGVAGHALRTVVEIEKAGSPPDFYMKTLHTNDYWSGRRPDQMKEVIDNYGTDNYWCMDPEQTIAFMAGLKRPWIAYKVLAAGAIAPRDGFTHAFKNGADFVAVGMYDFQIAEDVGIIHEVCQATSGRERRWCA